MHPHHLHATAAAWSLHLARTELLTHVTREARARGETLIAAAPISSPTYGTRHAVGDHGDPTGAVLVARPEAPEATWGELARRLDGRLTWLADQTGAAPGPTPLARIRRRLPRMQPGTVAVLVRHLVDEHGWIRSALRLDPAEELLAGTECPVCSARPLRLLPTGRHSGVVVCGDGCRCVGQGCRCRMPVTVEGVAHIWASNAVAQAA